MFKKITLALTTTLLSINSFAGNLEKTIENNLHLSSFIAPTAIYTSNNNFFGYTDDKISTRYMEAGLLGRYTFTNNLSFVAEGLYKGVGATANHPDIDFAFLDYTFYQDFNNTLGIRIGKVKLPFGFYNDTRDVPFTRNRIFLPQSIYFESFRKSVFSQNGVEFRGEHSFDWGSINWNLGITKSSDANSEVESLYTGASQLANFNGSNSGYFRLMYVDPNADFRAALSYSTLGWDVESKEPYFISSGKTTYNRTLLSLEYAVNSKLTFTTETEYTAWDFSQLKSPYIKNDYGLDYYIQASYKFNEKWDSFVSYGASYNSFSDKYGEKYAAQTILPIPAFQRYTKGWAVGVGYQPANNWLIRTEYNYYDGTSILPGKFNNSLDTKKKWQMVSFQIAYRFDIM